MAELIRDEKQYSDWLYIYINIYTVVLYIFYLLNQKLSIFGLFLTSFYHSPNQDWESL